ncbi:ABC transporter permease [Candidatus Woesearchaeota archaeon]|nr:ABC transporter permease [Candidatus Woesearchaeota archaeon]
MILDYFCLAFRSLTGRSVRTRLTMIGIFIGITAVVSLISLGSGLQDSINSEFEKIGKNRIMITPGGANFGPQGGDMSIGKMTEDDLKVVRKSKGVEVATAYISKSAKVKFKDELKFLNVWGFSTDSDAQKTIKSSGFLELEKGRQLKSGDKFKAVIGHSIAYDTFDDELRIGDTLVIEDKEFKIIGIQKSSTMSNDNIRIPLEVAREFYDTPDEISGIFALSIAGEEPSVVADRIKRGLRRFRNLDAGEEDFSVQTAEQMISQLNMILSIVTIFLSGIAAVSLIVGGIGIMNTMYTTVLERTREIGIMKAIGATNRNILLLFLIESGVLGFAGGLVGVFLGFLISKTGEFIAIKMGVEFFKSSFSLFLIFGSLAFSFLIGAISGILPARQASQLQPVEAFRK